VFKVFACVLGALVSLAFAWFGFGRAMENMAIGSTADVSDITTWPVYFLVPVVFVLLAVLYVLDAIVIARTRQTDLDLVTGQPAEPEPTPVDVGSGMRPGTPALRHRRRRPPEHPRRSFPPVPVAAAPAHSP